VERREDGGYRCGRVGGAADTHRNVSNIELKCVDEKAYQEHTIDASVPILKT
jgi:hypothetical protein